MRRVSSLVVCFVLVFGASALAPATVFGHHQDHGIDSDADGIDNFNDPCAYDPTVGCVGSTNTDGDAYNRFQDPCDDSADNATCDTDGDGEPNKYDPCPSLASGHLLGSDTPLPRQDRSCPPSAVVPEDSSSLGLGLGLDTPVYTEAFEVSPDLFEEPFPLPVGGSAEVDSQLDERSQASRSITITSDSRISAPLVELQVNVKNTGDGYKVERLLLLHVAGYAIELKCKGAGCPFKRRVRLPALVDNYEAAKSLRSAELSRGTKLELRVVRSEFNGRYYKLRLGAPYVAVDTDVKRHQTRHERRRGVSVVDRCLEPSSSRPVDCSEFVTGGVATRTTFPRPALGLFPLGLGRRIATASSNTSGFVDWSWTGPRAYAYFSRNYVHYIVLRNNRNIALAGLVCLSGGALTAEVFGVVCGAVVAAYQAWVGYQFEQADDRHQCVRFTAAPVPRAYTFSGYWIKPIGPFGWAKFTLEPYDGSHCTTS